MRPRSRRQILRDGLAVAGSGLLASCGWQPVRQVWRIGYLSASLPSANLTRLEAFRQGLRALGYVEGENVIMEYRWGEGRQSRVNELAAELVRLPVDVILAAAPSGTRAAKEATASIPIVMAYDTDPIGSGFVASLARPGGNITGLTSLAPGISAKQLEILRAIVRGLARVALFGTPATAGYTHLSLDPRSQEVARAAAALGVQLQYLDVPALEEIEPAFDAARAAQADGAIVLASPILEADRPRVIASAARLRLPTIYHAAEFTEAGGLLCYGVSYADLYRRAATYADKILKGASPAELPVEQPTKFDLVVNLQAARSFGLSIPDSVLAQATEIIR